MRSIRTLLLASSLLSGAAFAGADKPIIAPALPAWVKPQPLPARPDKPDEAPIRVLLADQQTRLEPGKVSNFVDVALLIQTPQGLAAGNLSLPWNPETDELTVHRLIIHRDGKQIDVLGEGQTFTVVRREPNLESATLDGVLTANIQPEGLQVGDILEYAATFTGSDPVLKGHVEQTGGTWNGAPFTRTHMSVEWPSAIPVAIRQNGALPPVKPVKAGATTRAELAMDNVQPIIPPRLAPARYAVGRVVEFSDFGSWADVGALMAPLYATAAVVPAQGPLRNELEKIKAASPDPAKRAEAALALVQDRIRYVALLMGAGGLVPAKAEETWARRYGDCKAKTALLLALLHELGIEADPVAANVILGDGIDQRLPMIGLFNHVLVRATIGGRAYWLDGTRSGDTSLARLRTPDFGWGLPLVAKNAALVRMVPEPLEEPGYDLAIDIDARAGLTIPAPVKAQIILRGDEATGTRLGLGNLDAAQRDNALREFWKDRLNDIEIGKVSATFDAATGTELMVMEGKAKMDWSDSQYWTSWTRVGYDADFSRTGNSNPEAPFAVGYPLYNRTVQTIQLPPGFTEANIWRKEPINETVGGLEYRRTSSLKDNVFRIERTMRATASEFPAADAPAAQKRLKALNDLPVSVRRPANYQMTTAELDEEFKTAPTTADGLMRRAGLLVSRNDYDGARSALDSALKLDPNDDRARGAILELYNMKSDSEGAVKYVRSIQVASVKQAALAMRMGGTLLMRGDAKGALAGYNRSLELQPDQPLVLAARAQAQLSLGNNDAAFADAAAAAKLKPKDATANSILVNVLMSLDRKDEALAAADGMVKASPDDAYVHVVAAQTFNSLGQDDRAMAEINRAITLKPDATTYLNRANMRAQSDVEGKIADFGAALKIDPKQSSTRYSYAELLRKLGRFEEAAEQARASIDSDPTNVNAYADAAAIYGRLGDNDKMIRTIDQGLAIKPTAFLYSTRIQYRPWNDFAGRESDIRAALALSPNDALMLSFKLDLELKTKNYAAAVKTSSELVSKYPDDPAMIGVRGIAYAKAGETAKADADFGSARAKALTASALNGLCYNKAQNNIALDRALQECDEALQKSPEIAAILDSKAFVLLRMSRLDESIVVFDKALAKSPNMAPSLYGRAVAWSKKGDKAKAKADRDAALKLDPKVDKTYEAYGVTM